jgi:hypothetical protein
METVLHPTRLREPIVWSHRCLDGLRIQVDKPLDAGEDPLKGPLLVEHFGHGIHHPIDEIILGYMQKHFRGHRGEKRVQLCGDLDEFLKTGFRLRRPTRLRIKAGRSLVAGVAWAILGAMRWKFLRGVWRHDASHQVVQAEAIVHKRPVQRHSVDRVTRASISKVVPDLAHGWKA